METFQKKKRGGGKGKLESDLETAKTTNALSKCRGRGAKKRKHVSRRGFYLYIRRACRHQTFNVSVLQRRRRKESETPASLTFVITQSNSQPASANSSAHLAPDAHVLAKNSFCYCGRSRTEAEERRPTRRRAGRPDDGGGGGVERRGCSKKNSWLRKEAADARPG